MTLSELIAKVSQVRPSEYDKDDLTQWVNEVEFLAWDTVIGHAEHPRIPVGDPVTVRAGEDNYKPDDDRPPKPPKYRPYVYEVDAERQLLIPDQFNEVYTTYLFSKIDFNNAEIERYSMEQQMFEAEWQTYAAWYRRTHTPKRLHHETTSHKYNPLEAD